MRLQICEVVSDLKHLEENQIIKVLDSQKVIYEWGYILHDKDTKEDGTLKEPH